MIKIILTVFLVYNGADGKPQYQFRHIEQKTIFVCYDSLANWMSQDPTNMKIEEHPVVELGGGCSKVVGSTDPA